MSSYSNFSGNRGFEWELRLLGVPRVSHKRCEQLVTLMGIRDINGIYDYSLF